MSDEATDTAAPALVPEHAGHGRYRVPGVDGIFPSKAAAEDHITRMTAAAAFENEYGDKMPEGEVIAITDHTLLYRGSVMELPMNELYLPDGDYSPHYDREWVWGWARLDGVRITAMRVKGYKPVTVKELEQSIKAGRTPEHYLSLVREEGSYLVYGDSVLMRCPRPLWRQRRAQKEAEARRFVRRADEQAAADADNAGMKRVKAPISNEITSGLTNSLEVKGL